jgi:hypothetical protein
MVGTVLLSHDNFTLSFSTSKACSTALPLFCCLPPACLLGSTVGYLIVLATQQS